MTEGRHRIKTEDSEMRQLVSDNEVERILKVCSIDNPSFVLLVHWNLLEFISLSYLSLILNLYSTFFTYR